jgi:hypothetical protein
MTIPEKCRVLGCNRDAEIMWEPLMNKHGAEVPVCMFHFRRKLCWYRGTIFDHTEDGIATE